jgi:hypothetical protein
MAHNGAFQIKNNQNLIPNKQNPLKVSDKQLNHSKKNDSQFIQKSQKTSKLRLKAIEKVVY